MIRTIDINCDMGEISIQSGKNTDVQFMPYISSCNIATGAHAGDDETIRHCMQAAKKNNVCIGVHPSYEDKENFGRKSLDISHDELRISIRHQLINFLKIAEEESCDVHHCKPHGALYNDLISNIPLATCFIEAVKSVDANLCIYGFSNSPFLEIVEINKMKLRHEVFADRRYAGPLELKNRIHEDACISDHQSLIKQLDGFVQNQKVELSGGASMCIEVQSICIHSDTPDALEMLKIVHQYLLNHGIEINHHI